MNKLLSRRLPGMALAAAAALAPGWVLADDGPTFTFSGFGTLGATVTNTDVVQFRTDLEDQNGATTKPDFGLESRLGGQVQARFGNDLSVMAQALAIRRVDKEMKPEIEWLFGQYSGIPNTDLRLGRMVLPAFTVSDTRFVGYSSPFLRVPVMVYVNMPASTVDGAQIIHRQTFGETVVAAQVSVGENRRSSIEITKIRSVNLSVEHGNWLGRVALTNSHADFEPPLTFVDDKFTAVGVQYDNVKYFVHSEYVKRRNPQHTFDAHAYYVGGGVRFGAWAPYLLMSKYAPEDTVQPAFSITVPGVPFPIGVKILTPEAITRTKAVGLRYDVAKNMAIKAEFARYAGKAGVVFRNPSGALTQPAEFTDPVNAFSLNLDFVF